MDRSTETRLEKTGDQVARKTEDLADAAAVKARETAQEVGEHIGNAADGLQDKLIRTGKDVGEVVTAVSDRVRSSAHYLQEQGMHGIVDDVSVLIKRYPIQAVLIGAGVGFFLARGRSR